MLTVVFLQCFIVSTVNALQTPMINASMVSFSFLWSLYFYFLAFLKSCFFQVLCDRHFGGINYPVGGVGEIAKSLAKGLVDNGSEILYKANVTSIILEQGKAVSVTIALWIDNSRTTIRSEIFTAYVILLLIIGGGEAFKWKRVLCQNDCI